MSTKYVIIKGGGIAGQVLRRELDLRGIPAALEERSAFPRRKVCGGILQPESWRYLKSVFDIRETPVEIGSISHFWRGRKISTIALPEPLVFMPRFELDAKLNAFNSRSETSAGAGPEIKVFATGIRARGDWLGFEAEAPPVHDLEMHYGRGIYLGISPRPQGPSHAAFIVKRARFKDPARAAEWGKTELGVELLGPLKGAGPIYYGPQGGERLAVGDAILTTHPFLGLGMKHAILSARLMAEAIESGKINAYPELHRRLFRKFRNTSALAGGIYETPFRAVLWPLLKFPALFLPAYRRLHREPVLSLAVSAAACP